MEFDRIIEGNGFVIAAVGMFVVFAGLVFISLFIAAIPRAFAFLDQRRAQRTQQPAPVPLHLSEGEDPVLLAAIACVIDLEREREGQLDDQRITIRRDASQRVWASFGQMRTLSSRI